MGILDLFRQRDDPSEIIAECLSGHRLTEDDVASGLCPREGCPTPNLFPEKLRVPEDAEEWDR